MEADGTYIALLDVAKDALFALDRHGVVLSWNRGAEELYGFTADEAIGQSFADLTVPAAERDSMEMLLEEVQRGQLSRRVIRHSKHGDRLQVGTAMRWITTDSGLGYVGVSDRDIRNELDRDEVRRVKSEFLSNMSHELRTPLNSIIGFAELMHKGKVGPMAAEHVEFLGDIATSARRLLGMVNDVLDLARLDAGAITFDTIEVDLKRLAEELRDVLKGPLAAKQLRLKVAFDDGCDRMSGDPVRLKQALYALVTHAAKVTPASSTITLRCGADNPGEIRIACEFGGPQMSETEMNDAFVEFHEPQAGLGLPLAQRICEAMGGRVQVATSEHGNALIAILPR